MGFEVVRVVVSDRGSKWFKIEVRFFYSVRRVGGGFVV